MVDKIVLAVGLFIVIYLPPGLKSSQVVPDGLVYTEVKKILVRGVQGVLTCRFYGVPLVVSWKKGLDPDDLSPLVVWYDGEVSGPRFDDGSFDVDEKYSLIINNVSTADAGRIYCTVSNNKGPLMKNYTDILVVDTAITTNPQVTLQMRQATYGILQCTVHINAIRVSWKMGTTSSANESLVVIENNKNVMKTSGAGYDEGLYNVTQDYSLVIKELQIHHEGLYVCEVTDDTGISFQNHTFVNVVAHPLEPFPTIQECLNAEQRDSNYCILVAKSGTTLTCQAVKYYPSLNLVFLYGSIVLEQSNTREMDNTDGTKNKTITIATMGNKELYTCVASSIPGTNGNKSTSVLLHGDEPVKSTLLIILLLFAALILISSVAYFIWRKKHLNYSSLLPSALLLELEDIVEVKVLTQEDFQALEQRVNDLLMKHYIKFHDLFKTDSAIQTEKIISDNRTALFDTHQMLIDWRESWTSARNKDPIDIEKEPDYVWPSDEELKTISHHLTQESMKKFCEELSIDCRNDDADDEGKRFATLRKWRTKRIAGSLKKTYMQIAPVLKSDNLGGLLPTLRASYVYKAELVDLAFNLLMQDLFPFAKALGINVAKLGSYRPAFSPSHLAIGTINLLIEIEASNGYFDRSCLDFRGEDMDDTFREIASLHYRNTGTAVAFEYDMSYGELCSISEAINQIAEGRADLGPEIEVPEEVGNLQEVLQLTDQDIPDRLDTSHPLTAVALFKIWKEKPRPSVFNYRAALAQKIRISGMPGLADKIIAGKYTKRTSLEFTENMVRGLNQDQLRSLGDILQLSGEKQHSHTTISFIKQIYDWVADWTTSIKWSNAKKHVDVNDKLVEHGFLELAREIMITERRQLNYGDVLEPSIENSICEC